MFQSFCFGRNCQHYFFMFPYLITQNDFVVSSYFHSHLFQITSLTIIAKFALPSKRIVEPFTQKYFCVFVEALVAYKPFKCVFFVFEFFTNGTSTNGIGIRSGKGFYFVFLEVAFIIVKGLSCSRSSSCCDIIIVLELPI